MIPTVDRVLAFADAHLRATIDMLQRMVELETPSGDAEAIGRFAALLRAEIGDLGVCEVVDSGAGVHVLARFVTDVEARSEGQILLVAHADTVWPQGTLARMPWREAEGRLWGPGVLDIKGGIAMVIAAMRALKGLKIGLRKPVTLLVVADEETGSRHSRALIEAEARKSECVLVVEPGTGLQGHLKTARKGIGDYRITVHGVAAHAGVDPAKGANSIVATAELVQFLAGTALDLPGTTVNPGVIRGGSRSNVVPAETFLHVDVRVPDPRAFTVIDARIKGWKPSDARCSAEIHGGLNRPPMVRTAEIGALFARAQRLGREVGLELQESATGGGSDGNFTAALGIPTLDGLGAVGEGAHADHESVLLEPLAARIALLGKLVGELAGES